MGYHPIGGAVTLILVMGWLAKSLITHLLDKDIGSYKLTLQTEKNAEIEKLKHDLDRVINEHKVRFEKLHERRDMVIATLYSRIVEFYQAIDRFVDFAILLDQDGIEKESQLLWKAVDSFKNYSEKNRIYFSEEICERLDSLYKAADKPTSSLMIAAEYSEIDKEGDKTLIESWQEARDALEGDVKKIRETLESDFRALLGVK